MIVDSVKSCILLIAICIVYQEIIPVMYNWKHYFQLNYLSKLCIWEAGNPYLKLQYALTFNQTAILLKLNPK